MALDIKCTEDISGKVPFAMKEAYNRIAHEAGANASELVRDHVCCVVHGVTYGEYVANARRQALEAQTKEQALIRARNSSPI